MNYTLYIDESGDFESEKGQWVLAGVLFSEDYETCKKHLINKMKKMPSEFNLSSIKDFHLTEFRRNFDNKTAVEMSKIFLGKLDHLEFDYHFLAAINLSKTSLHNREKTYRLMLADLLALCETVVPENEMINNLDLVIANRTINGEPQTTLSIIDKEVIKSLPSALEVDLATKGMVNLIGSHIKVRLEYANDSWGLVCADFLANLNYHNRKVREKSFLDELGERGKYSIFESFGGFEIRRANIAERNKDYVLSLYRWLLIGYQSEKQEKSQTSIQRLLHNIFNNRGTSGSQISFEAVIERLWRGFNDRDKLIKLAAILDFFESELIKYIESSPVRKYRSYLFRLRNLILLVDNHLARTANARMVAMEQNKVVSELISNPEHFQLILDFKITEIEIQINSLNFVGALDLANKYSQLMENYKEVWLLLTEQDAEHQFEKSRAYIKAEMTLLRCNALCIGLKSDSLSSNFIEKYESFEKTITKPSDLSRFNNYKVMLLLKQHKPKAALDFFFGEFLNKSKLKFNEFDMFWFLKAANDAALAEVSIDIYEIQQIVVSQLSFMDLDKKGHPGDLIFRELALFEFQLGNKSKALKYIKRCRNTFNLEKSEISSWLKDLISIHEDYIKGTKLEKSKYFLEVKDTSFLCSIYRSDNEMSFIEKVRYYSPY